MALDDLKYNEQYVFLFVLFLWCFVVLWSFFSACLFLKHIKKLDPWLNVFPTFLEIIHPWP